MRTRWFAMSGAASLVIIVSVCSSGSDHEAPQITSTRPAHDRDRRPATGLLSRRILSRSQVERPRVEAHTAELPPIPSGRLVVHVVNEGRSVEGARVSLELVGEVALRSAVSDHRGVATFESLPAGRYAIEARHPRHGEGRAEIQNAGGPTRLEISIPGPGLRGVVRSASGAAIRQVSLIAVSGTSRRTTWSDGEGRFALPSLAPGRWSLTARKRGFRATSIWVEIDEGERLEEDLVLEPGLSISGIVRGGAPSTTVIAAYDGATGSTGSGGRAVTGNDGEFEISGLEPGPHHLAVLLGDETFHHPVAIDAGTFGVIIDLAGGPGIIEGEVEFQGAPPPEIFSVRSHAGTAQFPGGGGSFRVGGVHLGRQGLTIAAAGFSSEHVVADVREGGTRVEVVLRASVRITGRIVDEETHAPIGGGDVLLRGRPERAVTGADGSFQLWSKPGRIQLEATARGYASNIVQLEVGRSLEPLEVTLSRGARVEGSVIRRGAPVVGAVVAVGSLRTAVATTRQDGTFVVDRVGPGPTEIVVSARTEAGSRTVLRALDVLDSGVTGVEIELAWGEESLLLELSGEPGLVMVWPGAGDVPGPNHLADHSAKSIRDGQREVRFDGLARGIHTVAFWQGTMSEVGRQRRDGVEAAVTRTVQVGRGVTRIRL